MEVGRKGSPLATYAAIGANDTPGQHSVETDYALAFTRTLFTAPVLGFEFMSRVTSPAVVARFSAVNILTTRPFGIWIEEIFCELVTLFQIGGGAGGANFTSLHVGNTVFSFDEPGLPSITPPADIVFESFDSPGITGTTGRVVAGGFADSLGGRFWLPPGINLAFGHTVANTAASWTVRLSYSANE